MLSNKIIRIPLVYIICYTSTVLNLFYHSSFPLLHLSLLCPSSVPLFYLSLFCPSSFPVLHLSLLCPFLSLCCICPCFSVLLFYLSLFWSSPFPLVYLFLFWENLCESIDHCFYCSLESIVYMVRVFDSSGRKCSEICFLFFIIFLRIAKTVHLFYLFLLYVPELFCTSYVLLFY